MENNAGMASSLLGPFQAYLHPKAQVLKAHACGLIALEKPAGVLSHPNGPEAEKRALFSLPYRLKEECYTLETLETGKAVEIAAKGEMEKTLEIGKTGESEEVGEMKETLETGKAGEIAAKGEMEKTLEISKTGESEEAGEMKEILETGKAGEIAAKGEMEKTLEIGKAGESEEAGEMKETLEMGKAGEIAAKGEMEKTLEIGKTGESEEVGEMKEILETGKAGEIAAKGKDRKAGKVGNTGAKLHILHRLDGPTSGLILVATDSQLARLVKDLFRERKVKKHYHCLVKGCPPAYPKLWVDRLSRKEGPAFIRMQAGLGTEAKTRWSVVHKGKELSCLLLEPMTGLSHQLRVQCALRHCPIVGDQSYGDFKFNRRLAPLLGTKNLCLHASSIKLSLIYKGQELTFEARSPLPAYFKHLA